MACRNRTSLVAAGLLVGAIALTMLGIAFATDYWVDVAVDRNSIQDQESLDLSKSNEDVAKIYYSRHSGVLRECFPAVTSMPWKAAQLGADEICFYTELDEPDESQSDNAKLHMHMQRAMLILCVMGVVSVAVSFPAGMVLCCLKNCMLAQAVGIVSFMGGVFILITIVLLHSSEYLTNNKDGDPSETIFQSSWTEDLREHTETSYGYSYFMAWIGLILAGMEGVIFLTAARAIERKARAANKDADSISETASDVEVVVVSRKRPQEPTVLDYGAYDNIEYNFPPMKAESIISVPVYPMEYPVMHPSTRPMGQSMGQSMMQPMPAYPALTYGDY